MKQNMTHLLHIFSMILLLAVAAQGAGGAVKDAESASHSDASAGYDMVNTYSQSLNSNPYPI